MSDLILDSLEIKNFRLFKHLEIERLGRVNLIVGKNSVGKTSLLEAIRIFASRGDFEVIWEILSDREENRRLYPQSVRFEFVHQAEAMSLLFHGYLPKTEISEPIRIGPLNSQGEMLTLKWKLERLQEGPTPAISVQYGEKILSVYTLDRKVQDYVAARRQSGPDSIRSIFLSATGLSQTHKEELWNADLEDDVVKALGLVSEVERLNFIAELEDLDNRDPMVVNIQGRVPMVKIRNIEKWIPLRSRGEGMHRLLGIALVLVNAQDGILLIDEIESGLHYSVQPNMWRLVFETAAKLNVQVFATTHSLDCLRAFESAAKERGEDESLLISLRRHHDEPEKIVAVLAGKEDLEIIIHSHIEAR